MTPQSTPLVPTSRLRTPIGLFHPSPPPESTLQTDQMKSRKRSFSRPFRIIYKNMESTIVKLGNRSSHFSSDCLLEGLAMAMSPSVVNFVNTGTKIVAVGLNYVSHIKEVGFEVPKEPIIFLKPTTSYLQNGGTIEIPYNLESIDYETELAVIIGKKARDVPEASAMDYVGGYALALDMTSRVHQSAARSARIPWTMAKAQDTFAPIGSALPKSMVPDHDNLELWLKVDGEIKQKGSTKDMLFKIPLLISYISSVMTLLEGDVILTGTPSGIGPVKAGQKITAGITGLTEISFDVQKRQKPASQ